MPGAGRPLPPDEAKDVPSHLRAGYRLLKNAGYVPPEIQAQRDLREVEDLLARTLPESDQAKRLTRRARWIETRLAETPRGRALLRDHGYGERIRQQLADSHSSADPGS